MRYVAYKSFTNWVHGRLGKKVRKAIPMCVTKQIRDAYPDAEGNYKGFVEVELEDL